MRDDESRLSRRALPLRRAIPRGTRFRRRRGGSSARRGGGPTRRVRRSRAIWARCFCPPESSPTGRSHVSAREPDARQDPLHARLGLVARRPARSARAGRRAREGARRAPAARRPRRSRRSPPRAAASPARRRRGAPAPARRRRGAARPLRARPPARARRTSSSPRAAARPSSGSRSALDDLQDGRLPGAVPSHEADDPPRVVLPRGALRTSFVPKLLRDVLEPVEHRREDKRRATSAPRRGRGSVSVAQVAVDEDSRRRE